MSDAVTNNILDIIPEINRGNLPHDMSAEVDTVIKAVKETGKKGSVTLKLTISPVRTPGTSEIQEADMTGEVSSVPPKPTQRPTGFYIARGGKLRRDNPNQLDFEKNPTGTELD